MHGDLVGALGGLAGHWVNGDACGQAKVANIQHMLGTTQAMHSLFKVRCQCLHLLWGLLFFQQFQCSQPCGAGCWVGRVGIAVGKLQHVLGAARSHEGVVNLFAGHATAQRLRAIGDLLGKVQNVGRDAKHFRRRPATAAAKAGDDFVKDQQDAVLRADLTQALQVTCGWNDHAC